MDVFAEAMAKTQHLVLDRSSMAGWEPPNASETVDDATRQTVLDRIIAALSYAGYVIEPDGRFPPVINQVEGRIQLEQRLAAARQRWREEEELLRKWREDGDPLEDHRRDDTEVGGAQLLPDGATRPVVAAGVAMRSISLEEAAAAPAP